MTAFVKSIKTLSKNVGTSLKQVLVVYGLKSAENFTSIKRNFLDKQLQLRQSDTSEIAAFNGLRSNKLQQKAVG